MLAVSLLNILAEGSKVMRTKYEWNFMKCSKVRHLKYISRISWVEFVEMKLK